MNPVTSALADFVLAAASDFNALAVFAFLAMVVSPLIPEAADLGRVWPEIRPFVVWGTWPFFTTYGLWDFRLGLDGAWVLIGFVVDYYVWTMMYHSKDDDDRWSKRRRKAAARVKEIAGRLVVVPGPVFAPVAN